MTTPHDTPEAVEAMAEKLPRWRYLGSPEQLSNVLDKTAAMLRRLHTRAVEAERERDDFRMRYETASADWCKADTEREALRVAIATARADALREASTKLLRHSSSLRKRDADDRGIPDKMGCSWTADAIDEQAAAILALIPEQEKPNAE